MKKEFKTRDLLTAAILKAKGAKLIGIDWKGNYAQFVFDNSDKTVDVIVDEIASSKSYVDIGELIKAFKAMKVLLENQ